MTKTLHLTLHRKWFDEIASGDKLIEWREMKPYWERILENKEGTMKKFDEILFVNGYGKRRPFMRVEHLGTIPYMIYEGQKVYGIYLGNILEVGNYEGEATK